MDILRNLMFRDNVYEGKIQRPRTGITIRIDSRGFREPQVRIFPKPVAISQQPYQKKKSAERKLPRKIIEPKVRVKRLAKEMIITILLPDVNSEKDIELNRFTDSIEIRAFARNKGYFKILIIPKNHRLVEKSLDDGKLNLKFAIWTRL